MFEALKSLKIHLDEQSRVELARALTKPESPCLPGRRSKLRYWWQEHGPRIPKWDATVYRWYADRPGADDEYEALYTLYGLNWMERSRFKKLMNSTDCPLVVVAKPAWD